MTADHRGAITRRLVLAGAAGSLATPALAQSGFPNRNIRLIVPWAPGGTTDVVFRVLATAASKELGQPVVVENRGGAGGVLGAQYLASGQARPDGYTLSQSHMGTVRQPFMRRSLSYDPVNDITYIIRLSGYMFGMVVRTDSPLTDWNSFVAYARANPEKLTHGSSGVGSDGHVFSHIVFEQAGIKLQHVPFRGIADALTALLSGQIDCVGDGSGWAPGVEGGSYRLLNVWTEERSPRFPQAPTLRELGINMAFTAPFGVSGPKAMDPGLVRVLHDAFHKALLDPAHREVMQRYDLPLAYMNSADYTTFIREEAVRERELVSRLGLVVE
ncbi:Bug family tripartite tricarboxylate transporter substrate binding protein [Humitalea sp. 24SJ18S-53]|uniref:Bug family tripartite tricarboxylate transporter substrate binding protein n=1 Tax=Humitalea sp. 24SJ18S-53 TaxID=3422307 RepID=UPI003D67F894